MRWCILRPHLLPSTVAAVAAASCKGRRVTQSSRVQPITKGRLCSDVILAAVEIALEEAMRSEAAEWCENGTGARRRSSTRKLKISSRTSLSRKTNIQLKAKGYIYNETIYWDYSMSERRTATTGYAKRSTRLDLGSRKSRHTMIAISVSVSGHNNCIINLIALRVSDV